MEGPSLALGIHSAGPVHLWSDSSYFGETKWQWDRRGGNRLESPTDTQKVEECWPVLYPPSSTASQHEVSWHQPPLPARAFFWKASSALIYCFAEGNMVDLLNIVLYMSYLYLVLNWQPWGISFWSLSPCFPSHCHSREWWLNQSAESSRCKKTPLKNNHGAVIWCFGEGS